MKDHLAQMIIDGIVTELPAQLIGASIIGAVALATRRLRSLRRRAAESEVFPPQDEQPPA